MSILDLAGLVVLGVLVWFWWDSFRAHEAGADAVRTACESENLQLLDDTIALASLKPARNADGSLRLKRTYKFEYSDTGNNRRNGSVVLLGCRVVAVHIGLRLVPSGATLH